MSKGSIVLKGVRTHNLKNVDITIPHNELVVITGVSGSGKSSLAFDTLYAEGQRRYVESLSSYARQFLERMEKPDIEFISGILPAIAIEAKNPVSNARSTVGTQTEINDYLRVFFSRIGKTFCSKCKRQVQIEEPDVVAQKLIKQNSNHWSLILFDVQVTEDFRKYTDDFLQELSKEGFLRVLVNNEIKSLDKQIFDDENIDKISIVVDRIQLSKEKQARLIESLELGYRYGKNKISVKVSPEPSEKFPTDQKSFSDWKTHLFSRNFHCADCQMEYTKPTPHMFSFNSPLGACDKCQGFGRIIDIDWNLVVPDESKSLGDGAIEPWTKPSASWEFGQLKKYCSKKKIPWDKPFKELSKAIRDRILYKDDFDENFSSVQGFFKYLEKKTYKMHIRIFLSKYRGYFLCPDCKGCRLKPNALSVKITDKNIHDLCDLTLGGLKDFLEKLKLTQTEMELTEPILEELKKRSKFLNDVGLKYLTLNRLSRTLSGGESQRINLATSLGSSLVDTLYVLDEPSIGLHERDNQLLINLLKELRELGNTVVVVEHDSSMIEMADQVIDIGPFAGARGGEVIFNGDIKQLLKSKNSLTAKYLRGEEKIERTNQITNGSVKSAKKDETANKIVIHGAKEHNLKGVTVEFPLHQFCVVTGVSGSGKSTLLYDVLYNNYLRYRGRPVSDIGQCDRIEGFDDVSDIILIDQSPIGRTPRSNPITYLKAFDHIRQLFSKTTDAQRRALGPGAFSFNVTGGRCEACQGDGKIKVEMHFMADVFIECEKCKGTRYQPHILEIRYRGKNIHQVLSMTVEEALDFFRDHEKLISKLKILQNVGLGYLCLGQSANTLSAGEAQRLKLALEMSDFNKTNMLYVFDEPTTGLHYHDIKYLIKAFDELITGENSLLIIEHNLEVIRCADHVTDLGPDGGDGGGELLYSGSLKGLLKEPRSYTGQCLKKKFKLK